MSDVRMNDRAGLVVDGTTVYYGQHQALNHVSISVKPGEVVVILGANGAGKSTLLQSIAGLVTRSAGTASMDGHPLMGLRPHQIVESGLALVPEGRGIFGDLTVEENLLLGAYAKRARASEQQNLERIYSLFPRLVERRRQVARTMSGGEQQMVAIGRAMMSNPSILMLDEPSLGLSPLLASDVFKTIKEVRKTGLGILLVEQNAKQSLSIADRGYLIETGQIVAENSASALMNDPAVQKAYLGGAGGAQDKTTVRKPAQDATVKPSTVEQPVEPVSAKPDRPRIPEPYEVARVSVRDVTGHSVGDLIRTAEARQRAQWQQGAAAGSPSEAATGSDTSQGALADMLRRMETSAASASRPSARAPGYTRNEVAAEPKPIEDRSEPESSKPSSASAGLEIYRKPSVEVYRREDNDEGESSLTLIRKHRI